MPDYGLIPTSRSRDRTLAQCGPWAGILYGYSRGHADPYGRLEASPTALADTGIRGWHAIGMVTEEQIVEARNQLVTAGLWHYYKVGGVEYVEYTGWDADQQPAHLNRRAYRPKFPDDPRRPDLWARNRTHRVPTRYDDSPAEPQQPRGSADLPAESAQSATGVPTSGAKGSSAGVPTSGAGAKKQGDTRSPELQQFIDTGIKHLRDAHEKHTGRPLSSSDRDLLVAVLTDAHENGVEWQTLMAVMTEKQEVYKPTRTNPYIQSCSWYKNAWDAHIRTAREERQQPKAPGTGPPGSPGQIPDWMRPPSTDDVAEAG